MKKLPLLFVLSFLFLSHTSWTQELKIGQNVTDIDIALIDQERSTVSLKELKGKVLLIDFWATWCSPCISGMKHLNALQNEFTDELQIISVTSEERDRIKRFKDKRPQGFWFGLDPDENVRDHFPYRVIPHSILINADGKVIAITSPGEITSTVIKQVLAGKSINLPLKKDNTEFDPSIDYFAVDSTINESFVIQPYNPDIPTFTKAFSGIFKDRRLSLHNVTIPKMYRDAFETSSYRLVYEVDESHYDYKKPKNKYNVDIIIPAGKENELHRIFQQKLLNSFELKARVDHQEREVVVLSRLKDTSLLLVPSTEPQSYTARGDNFKSEGARLEDFRSYLENFGIVGYPVVDETGIEGFHSIDFSFDPENSGSFMKSLNALGLKVKKEKRVIEVLVLYEEPK